MSFVVVQHLSPTHKSMMVDILSKHTAMSVVVAVNACKILPDHVYALPLITTNS
jgi:two-component system CheB/CheR fusion protein